MTPSNGFGILVMSMYSRSSHEVQGLVEHSDLNYINKFMIKSFTLYLAGVGCDQGIYPQTTVSLAFAEFKIVSDSPRP